MSYAANSRANNPQDGARENPGPVAKDSLAAESLSSGGGFAENENAATLGVSGANSTLNTTDTSGASVLQPARDASSRAQQDDKGLGSDERGHTGVRYPEGDIPQFSGVHSQEGYVGGQSTSAGNQTTSSYSGASGDSFADGTSGQTGSSFTDTAGISSGSDFKSQGTSRRDEPDTYGSSSGNRGNDPIATGGAGESYGISHQPEADTAPNYAAAVSGAIEREGYGKPKGSNLTEGSIPETKTFTGNVGGAKDPGRLAEQDFNKMGAGSTVAAGERQYGSGQDSSTGGAFDTLQSEPA